MANVLFGWPIYSDDGVVYTPSLSGGSWSSTLPLNNIKDRRLAKVARSTNALLASTRLRVDLGADRTLGLVAIPKHNLSSAAFWRVVGVPSTSDVLLDYVAGQDLTALGATATRTTTAVYYDRDGILRTAAINEARDGHYISEKRYLLVEPGSTNLCLRSQEFDLWSLQNALVVTANAVTAPDGTVTGDLLTSDGSITSQAVYRTISSFTGDGAKVLSVFLKAGTATSTDVSLYDFTAATQRHVVNVAWADGVPTVTTQEGSGTIFPVEALSNGWYRISFTASGVVAANGNRFYIYGTGTGTAAGTVYAWGAQAENALAPTSYIATTTVTVTRGGDVLYFPISDTAQEMTVYADLLDLGTRYTANSRYWQLSGAANVAPRALTYFSTTALGFLHDPDGTSVSSMIVATHSRGSRLQMRSVLHSTGAAQFGLSIDGAAESTASSSAADAIVSPWSGGRFYLSGQSGGPNAFERVSVRTGVKTMAQMEAAIYDSGIVSTWPSGATAEDLEGINTAALAIIPSTAPACRYVDVILMDPDNSDGYVDVARLVVGGRTQPTLNMDYGAKLGLESDTVKSLTDGGAAVYNEKPIRRTAIFTIGTLPESEAMGAFWRMKRILGVSGQFMFVYNPDDTTLLHERSFLAVMSELSALEFPYYNRATLPFAVVEEL